jgi:hypothetical protein
MAVKLKAETIKKTIRVGTLMGNLLYELAESPAIELDRTDKKRCLDLRDAWQAVLREMEPTANG